MKAQGNALASAHFATRDRHFARFIRRELRPLT